MANKYLKTLTIGGVPMDVHTHDVSRLTDTKKVNYNTAWARVDGATITLTETGLYLIKAQAVFPQATTTGATQHALSILSSLTPALCDVVDYDGTSDSVRKLAIGFRNKTAGNPETITVQVQCARALSGQVLTIIDCFKASDIFG